MSGAGERMSELRRAAGEVRSGSMSEPAAGATLTLVPGSSIQFIDLPFDEMKAVRVRRRFFEDQADAGDDGPTLHAITIDNDQIEHPVTGAPLDVADTYAVDMEQALLPYLGSWVPVPFLKVSGEADNGTQYLEDGPTNWARAFVTRKTLGDGRRTGPYRIVLAIDTAIDVKPESRSRAYAAPRMADVEAGTTFRFSDDESDIAGFVSEAWIDDWLADLYREHEAADADSGAEDEAGRGHALEHLAHYLTLLRVLAEGCEIPELRFARVSADSREWNAVGVDLALDLGASRITALLREKHGSGAAPGLDAMLLPLRDLSQPWRTHSGIMPSRLEFSRTALGNEAWSRWSGRTNAFFWPSLARVGREAERLAAELPAGDDHTGISSPMCYLWDERPSPTAWRFVRQPGRSVPARGALVSGLQLSHFTESGDVPEAGARSGSPAKPRFSRSSLVTFMTAELLAQAVVAVNAPRTRRDARPRVIERILVTLPAYLSDHEERAARRRVTAAVGAVWQAMGWNDGAPLVPPRPEVLFLSDNALNTGLAYLHNEMSYKFRGKAREYVDLMGKQRPEHKGGRSLRVASLDIGGGGTSLSIATYELTDTGTLARTPQLADGARVGGNDILKVLVERHLIPALERRLVECKLLNARRFLSRILGGRSGRRAQPGDDFGRRFAAELAKPLAIGMLETYLGSRVLMSDVPVERTVESLVSLNASHARAVLDELDELAADEGADTFSPHEVMVAFRERDIAAAIRRVLDPVLRNTARVVQAFDCDVVLVSGWAARLPAVMDALVEFMPSQLNRIVSMAEYRVAGWYPQRERSGTIGDSKSAAAMGALLATGGLAAGGLELVERLPEWQAGRACVGRMNEAGLLRNDAVMFVLGDEAGDDRTPKLATLTLELPAVLGCRRIGLESWPASPLYWVDHEPADHRPRARGSVKLTVERSPGDGAEPDGLRLVRACDTDGNNLPLADMAFRVQTLATPGGHWLDTGRVVVE